MGCNYCQGPNGNNYSQKVKGVEKMGEESVITCRSQDYPRASAPAAPPVTEPIPKWKQFETWCAQVRIHKEEKRLAVF